MTVIDRVPRETRVASSLIAGTPVNVEFDLYEPGHVSVVYGDGNVAALNTDYLVSYNGSGYTYDYTNFNFIPTVALVNKIALAVAAGEPDLVVLTRQMPYVQPYDVAISGKLDEQGMQLAIDRSVLLMQQLQLTLSGFPTLPPGEVGGNFVFPNALARAGNLLGFDANGDPIAVASVELITDFEAQLNAAAASAASAAANAASAAASAAAAAAFNPSAYSTTTETAALISAAVAGRLPHLSAGLPLPTTNIGPIWHDGYAAVMTWRTIGSYTGYVSVNLNIVAHAASQSAPSGWLIRDGSEISRTAYAALYAAIGTIYGAGNGSTTFNLPDARGVFDRGWDNGRGYDSGRVFGSYQTDAIQDHYHMLNGELPSYVSNRSLPNGGLRMSDQSSNVTYTKWLSEGGDAGRRWAAETRPKSHAYLPIIKY